MDLQIHLIRFEYRIVVSLMNGVLSTGLFLIVSSALLEI